MINMENWDNTDWEEWENRVGSYSDGPEFDKTSFVFDENFFEPWTRAQEEEEEEEGEEGTQAEEQTPAEEIISAIWVYNADMESYCETPEAVRYYNKLLRAISKDDSWRFVKLIEREKLSRAVRRAGIVFHPLLLLHHTVYGEAAACAESMLKGQASLEIDVNRAPNVFDPEPLIVAATSFQPRMVNLLADDGARFDIRCRAYFSPYYLMFPLEAAVESLRSMLTMLLSFIAVSFL